LLEGVVEVEDAQDLLLKKRTRRQTKEQQEEAQGVLQQTPREESNH